MSERRQFALLAGCLTCAVGVACAAHQARVLEIAAEDCVQIAKAHGRQDIAEACQVAEDIAPILERLMADGGAE